MKKIFSVVLIGISFFILGGCTSTQGDGEKFTYGYNDVKDKIIRFHVLANSDSERDQKIKLKVKDDVIKYLAPLLENSKSINESREILKREDKKIIEIAEKRIKKEGFEYSVKTSLSRENFPEKFYGNIILPQGEYEAYRILIGENAGQNWWCVMFPPLCFTDVTKGEIAYNETKEKMDSVIGDSESISLEEEPKIEYKFKIVEVFDEIF